MLVHNLGVLNCVSLAVFFTASRIFLVLPRTAVGANGSGAWLSILIAGVVTTVPTFALQSLLRRYPGKSFPDIIETALGRIAGMAANLILFLFFYYGMFITLRQFSESIVEASLPRTPLPVITICFLGGAAYGVLRGVESLARLAWICVPFTAAGLGALLVGGLVTYVGKNSGAQSTYPDGKDPLALVVAGIVGTDLPRGHRGLSHCFPIPGRRAGQLSAVCSEDRRACTD